MSKTFLSLLKHRTKSFWCLKRFNRDWNTEQSYFDVFNFTIAIETSNEVYVYKFTIAIETLNKNPSLSIQAWNCSLQLNVVMSRKVCHVNC